MQTDIQPDLKKVDVQCGCGHDLTVYATTEDLTIEVCSECHPFYTGQQKYVDSEGRVEKFQEKYDWSEEHASRLAGKEDQAESATDDESQITNEEE